MCLKCKKLIALFYWSSTATLTQPMLQVWDDYLSTNINFVILFGATSGTEIITNFSFKNVTRELVEDTLCGPEVLLL